MKKLLLFLLFLPLTSYSQLDTLYNFKIHNNELIWQHTFKTTKTTEDLKIAYITNTISTFNTSNLNELKNRITFSIEKDKVNFKKFGGSWGNTATFVQYPINYLVVVDFKDFKYRVTIKSTMIDYGRLGITSLEDTTTKKRTTIFKNSAAISDGLLDYDNYFLDKYSLKNILIENDDW